MNKLLNKQMKLKIFIIIVFSLSIVFSSCNKRIRYIYERNQPADTVYTYKVKSEPYRLKPNDVLHINILTTDENVNKLFQLDNSEKNSNSRNSGGGEFYLTGFTVNDTGYVQVPILGNIYAEDKTVADFRSDVTAKTHQFLNNAIVNVKLVSFKVSFLGEVTNQGPILIYQDNIDILQGISRAGGITDYGNMTNVTVVRQEEDKRLVYKLDLTQREILNSNKFYLYPDDIVIVEPIKAKVAQLNLRDYFFFFSTFSSAISTTVIVLNVFQKK